MIEVLETFPEKRGYGTLGLILLPFFANSAIIAAFLQIIASANNLVEDFLESRVSRCPSNSGSMLHS